MDVSKRMVPSLENICRVPAMVVLSNHIDVKKQIFSSSSRKSFYNYEKWNGLQSTLSEILKDYNPVLECIIPSHLLRFIGREMLRWADYLRTCFNLPLKFSQDFIKSSFFTSKGLIDEEKAAKNLLEEPSINALDKFNIACQYFLQDNIIHLWRELRNNERNFKNMLRKHKSKTLMIMWTKYLEEIESTTSVQRMRLIKRKFRLEFFSYGIKNNNVAAIKLSFGPKRNYRNTNTRKLIYRLFYIYIDKNRNLIEKIDINLFYYCISMEILAIQNITVNFISLIEERKLKTLLVDTLFTNSILQCFLYWPYQDQFMNIAQIAFENLDEDHYLNIMKKIIRLLDDEYLCLTYNYRQLLQEFWIKSPSHLKIYVIKFESGQESTSDSNVNEYLIEGLFTIKNFTDDDMKTINLILEYATSLDKEKILLAQGKEICERLLYHCNNFRLVDLFLRSLDLNEDILREFRKEFLIELFPRILPTNFNLMESFFKLVVGNDEIEDLREEIFHLLTHSVKIEYLFVEFREETQFSFLNKILKWFLKTDNRIEEWKNNINTDTVFSLCNRYEKPEWFDQLLKYLGNSNKEASVITWDLLLRSVPQIAKYLFKYKRKIEIPVVTNIWFLCSYKIEKGIEFIDILRIFYKDSFKQNICLLCMNNNLVHNDGDETQLYCELHGTNGFIRFNSIDKICRFLSRQFDILPTKHEIKLKTYKKFCQKMKII